MKRIKHKPQRGGKRPGAGRKATGIAPLHCYPKVETISGLRQQSKSSGKTLGQIIDTMHAEIFKL